MKRAIIYLLLLTVTSPALSGCFGKFALTRKVYDINASVPHKVLRNVVMWAFVIFPVYYVTGLVDLIILNTFEFWTGRNPVAAAEKDFRYVSGDQRFEVRAVKNGDDITYTIDRFSRDRYRDTLTIACSLADSTARATLRDHDGVRSYATAGGSMMTSGTGMAKTGGALSLSSLNR